MEQTETQKQNGNADSSGQKTTSFGKASGYVGKVQHPYADILDMPRPLPGKHAPMSRMMRAAQYAPFAALTGYDDEVSEAARLTDRKTELAENEKQIMDRTIQTLMQKEREQPKLRVTYFVPDDKKEGGSYRTVEGTWKKLEPYARVLVLSDGKKIPLDDILALEEIQNKESHP